MKIIVTCLPFWHRGLVRRDGNKMGLPCAPERVKEAEVVEVLVTHAQAAGEVAIMTGLEARYWVFWKRRRDLVRGDSSR
jgi:hypothetical protein